MNRKTKKFHAAIMICLTMFHPYEAFANPRLDRVQRTYFERVDELVATHLNSVLAKYSQAIQDIGKETLLEMGEESSELTRKLADVFLIGNDATDYKSMLVEQKRVNQALAEIIDSDNVVHSELDVLKRKLGHIDQQQICAAAVASLLLAKLPHYSLDENIDLSQIPSAQLKHVRAEIGSDIDSADVVEKTLYLPATTGGCIAGQSIFFFLPVVGCAIGAVVGAAVAYGVGKASTAVITTIENQKEYDAYQSAIAEERHRQELEIAQARAWMNEHPISDQMLLARGIAFCLTHPILVHEQLLLDASELIDASAEGKHLVAEHAKTLSEQASSLRNITLNNLQEQNALLVKNKIQEISDAASSNDRDSKDIQALRQSLATCLLEEARSCESIGECVNEAQIELDNLDSHKDLHWKKLPFVNAFEAELDTLRSDVAQCEKDKRSL